VITAATLTTGNTLTMDFSATISKGQTFELDIHNAPYFDVSADGKTATRRTSSTSRTRSSRACSSPYAKPATSDGVGATNTVARALMTHGDRKPGDRAASWRRTLTALLSAAILSAVVWGVVVLFDVR
jgi:hypothetical protein